MYVYPLSYTGAPGINRYTPSVYSMYPLDLADIVSRRRISRHAYLITPIYSLQQQHIHSG